MNKQLHSLQYYCERRDAWHGCGINGQHIAWVRDRMRDLSIASGGTVTFRIVSTTA